MVKQKDLLMQIVQAVSSADKVGVCVAVSDLIRESESSWECVQFLAEKAEKYWFSKEQDEPETPEVAEILAAVKEKKGHERDDGYIERNGQRLCITYSDAAKYHAKYQGIVKGIIDLLSNNGYSKQEYYQCICKYLSVLFSEDDAPANGAILYAFLLDTRTPYYEVNIGLRMTDTDYRNTIKTISPQIDKMQFVFQLLNSQKTETASQILDTMNELETREQKTVFLCQVIDYLREKKNK